MEINAIIQENKKNKKNKENKEIKKDKKEKDEREKDERENQETIENKDIIKNQKKIEKTTRKNFSILKNLRKIIFKLQNVVIKLGIFFLELWILLPIIFGILIPMVYLIPLAYTSWKLFMNDQNGPLGDWVNVWFGFPRIPIIYHIFILFEISIFIIGLVIFCKGVYILAKNRRRNISITTSGIYHLIRHPQNFGLILMIFPLTLDVPIVNESINLILFGQTIFPDPGIRFGEILSWTLFSVILVIISLIEERKMMKAYPQDYSIYQSSTSFFIPILFKKNKKDKKNSKKSRKFRYKNDKQLFLLILLIICNYLVFLIAMYYFSLFMAKIGLLIWSF
ncbi:methyltransferase family protein [Candidatus Harpocratesius sp.]